MLRHAVRLLLLGLFVLLSDTSALAIPQDTAAPDTAPAEEAVADAAKSSAEAGENLTGLVDRGRAWLEENGPSLAIQTAIFLGIVLAFWVLASIVGRFARKGLDKSKLADSKLLCNFIVSVVRKGVLLLGVLIAAATIGFQIGPLLAGLGVAGFVLGFALQDTLSNFAAGMMVMIYRPFDLGDVVEAGGVKGSVKTMNLVSTTITTPDNQTMIVPNSKIWGGVITNVTSADTRRVDMTFGIGYEDDIEKAERVLEEVVKAHPQVLEDPAPAIRLHSLGESSVDFVVRPWSKTSDYWAVYWDVTREVKRRFDAEGISIPYPQRDLHVYQQASS